MLNDFVEMFLGCYDNFFPNFKFFWEFRATLAVALLVVLLWFACWCCGLVVRSLAAWIRPKKDGD